MENENKKVDLNFLNSLQKQASASEPTPAPGETAGEFLLRTNKQKVEEILKARQQSAPQSQPQPSQAPREVVFYKGYKLSRDLFTCLTMCILALNDPAVNEVLSTFGFTIKDLEGNLVSLKKEKKKRPSRKRK